MFPCSNGVGAAFHFAAGGFQVTQEDAKQAFAHTRFSGRFSVLCRRPFVVVDGAHNPEGIAGLGEILSHIPCPKRIAAGMLGDKAVEENLKLLSRYSDTLICLPVDNPRALSPEELPNWPNLTLLR